ncbi:myosin-9 [Photinus pyralis]|uniref:myosin-9 n=1 Tax=Photinus pyralis TaxID=7054 RepID=UPI001267436F|nr:myosin-9 [Photinus pyralis]XP_031350153.1 myosin-9 [Photinus pyralis]
MDNEIPIVSTTTPDIAAPEERLNDEKPNEDLDNTMNGFNCTTNITVIEKPLEVIHLDAPIKNISCEGSDSGVEVVENCCLQRALSINSNNSQEFGTVTPAYSYESSIISCCSNYEEAYNILARRNSTLFEDYKLRTCDGTSEGGSESSSIAGGGPSKRVSVQHAKKKYITNDCKNKNSTCANQRSRPPASPRNPMSRPRGKSIDKTLSSKQENQRTSTSKAKNNNLTLPVSKKEKVNPPSRASSSTRTPITTPTDDGRWPSINSKPAPLMSRSVRGLFQSEATPKKVTPESKSTALEKYATLPRRRKEKSADNLHDLTKKQSTSKEPTNKTTIKRQSSTPKSLPPYPRKKSVPKTKIYHETSVQTALTQTDIEKAFLGVAVNPAQPQDIETCDKNVQVDSKFEEIENLKAQLEALRENHDKLLANFNSQNENLSEVKQKLDEEQTEKNALRDELKQNTDRVLAILGNDSTLPEDENVSSDSLMMLENRYQKVSQIVIKQENEISELNAYCRSLQRDLEKSVSSQNVLLQQQHDLESESVELQEFMQAEKTTLTDALKESENEINKLRLMLGQKDKEIEGKHEESKRLIRFSEQRRQENISLHARLGAFEMRSRELLIYQGSHISGATVALTSLINRLDGLVDELVTSYSISEQDLEDVIFHNEAYTNSSSSPEITPEKTKKSLKENSPSPKRGSSFVSAIINAIKNATAQTSFLTSKEYSKDTISLDNSDSTEMLDSETEPCLMMEPVLEDVLIPDGHSRNMISSGHGLLSSARLTQSESLNNLFCRQMSEQKLTENLSSSFSGEMPSLTEICPPVPLVDQVIDVDNLVTKLLKVLRIIQIENDDCMNELQDDHDLLSDQVNKQKDANKIVAQQLKDWEVLGAHLKREITELMQQLSRKNNEIDDLKSDLNHNRKEIERLNEDVCALSTACSKAEQELKIKKEETEEAIKKWESKEEIPSKEVLAKVFTDQKEIPVLKETLAEKEKQLSELQKECCYSRKICENWKEAVDESKKQYEAIDSALEILNSIQTVVQQCPPLAKLQRDLEETSFQTASSIPVASPSDCNANGTLLKSVNNLEIPSPINSTA